MLAADRSRALPLASILSVLAVAAGVVWAALVRARDLLLANHDVGWFLHAGSVWVDGGRIGADVVDTNPPLVIWLSGLEVLAARATGAAPLVVHALVSCAVSFACVWLAARAFLRAGVAREALWLWAPIVLAAATALAGYDFGQRDHWLAFLILPHAGWALVPGRFSRERVLAGLCAGLAVALKPHHLLALLVIELFRLARFRSLRQLVRAELLCAAALAPLYLLAIHWSAPSYWDDLRDTLAVYEAYGRAVPLWSRHTVLALCALVLAAPAGLLRPRTALPFLLASLALSARAAAWLQHKDFSYHHLPGAVFAAAALALGFALLAARGVRGTGAALGLVSLVTAACLWTLRELPREPRDAEVRLALRDALDRHTRDGRVFVFSTAVGATFPAVNFAGARSLSPYSCLWPIAGNYTVEERGARPFPYRTLAEMPPIERRMVERVVAVLARERPSLLVFDRRPFRQGFGPTELDLRRYLEAHPDFVALLGSYRILASEPAFEYYGRRGE